MEPHDTFYTEPLDQVISETLRERLGAPPSRDVWERIAKDIARPPHRSTLEILLAMFYAPMARSAFIVAMLVVVVVQPAFYWIHKDYPANPLVLPQSPRSRPLPEGDLRLSDPLAREQAPAHDAMSISFLQSPTPSVEAR